MSTKLLTIKEAADMIGVTTLTLRNWDKSGKLPSLRHPMNNYRVYKLEEIEKLISDIETGKFVGPRTSSNAKKLVVKHLPH